MKDSKSSKDDLRASRESYLASVLSAKRLNIDDMVMNDEPLIKTQKSKVFNSGVNDDLIRLKRLTANQPVYDHAPKWMKMKKPQNLKLPTNNFKVATLSPGRIQIVPREKIQDQFREVMRETENFQTISSYTHAKHMFKKNQLEVELPQTKEEKELMQLNVQSLRDSYVSQNIYIEDPIKVNNLILRTFSEIGDAPKFDKRAKSVFLKNYHYKTLENEKNLDPQFQQNLENTKISNLLQQQDSRKNKEIQSYNKRTRNHEVYDIKVNKKEKKQIENRFKNKVQKAYQYKKQGSDSISLQTQDIEKYVTNKQDEQKWLSSQWIERALHTHDQMPQKKFLRDAYSFTKKHAYSNATRLSRQHGPSMLKLFYPDFNDKYTNAIKVQETENSEIYMETKQEYKYQNINTKDLKKLFGIRKQSQKLSVCSLNGNHQVDLDMFSDEVQKIVSKPLSPCGNSSLISTAYRSSKPTISSLFGSKKITNHVIRDRLTSPQLAQSRPLTSTNTRGIATPKYLRRPMSSKITNSPLEKNI